MSSHVIAPRGLRLVALDIDDTLIPWRGVLSREVVDAVREAREAGVEVVLASGRHVSDVVRVGDELGGAPLWALCSNGSVTVRIAGGVATEHSRVTFDPRAIVTALRELDPLAPVAAERSGLGFLVDGEAYPGQAPHIVGMLGEVPTEVSFLSIASATLSAEQLLGCCETSRVHAVPYPHEGWVTVDIVSALAGKGAALASLAASLGIGPEHCAAVGDYLNDIPMLTWAGWSVAMGQAPAQVRAVADAVVATSAEHGAAEALRAVAAAANRM